jgi:hypothetical protein
MDKTINLHNPLMSKNRSITIKHYRKEYIENHDFECDTARGKEGIFFMPTGKIDIEESRFYVDDYGKIHRVDNNVDK